MKIVSYNIFEGAKAGLDKVINVVRELDPDILALQEANSFANDEKKILLDMANQLGLSHAEIALAGEYDYHVATLSKHPFKTVKALPNFRNACLQTIVDTPFGEIAICNTHLSPISEVDRLKEVEEVVKVQKVFQKSLILGDLNSLSEQDNYKEDMIGYMNEGQKKKFAIDNILQFDVVKSLLVEGYVDSAVAMSSNAITTVPTTYNTDESHTLPLRLDYILLSQELAAHLIDYQVVKNDQSNQSSDHFPIYVTLE